MLSSIVILTFIIGASLTYINFVGLPVMNLLSSLTFL